jgi:hypothetical protein
MRYLICYVRMLCMLNMLCFAMRPLLHLSPFDLASVHVVVAKWAWQLTAVSMRWNLLQSTARSVLIRQSFGWLGT